MLCHINLDMINTLAKDCPLRDLIIGTYPVCKSCLEGKMTKRPFSTKGQRATQPLELLYPYDCGPLNLQVRGSYEYYFNFIDDYSRYVFPCLMVKKSITF